MVNICEDYYGGHKYSSDWTIDTAATCTKDGSKSQRCERCDTQGNITVIPATGHTMQKTDKVEAACTTPGKEAYYTCGTCGKHFEDEAGTVEIANLDEYGNIPATGHTFAWIVDKEATAAEAGLKHEECTVCGYAKAAVEIPAKETADGPQTGDSGNLVLWAAVMLAAGATVIGTVLYRQKKKISR